jgi:hypothetical protein
MIPARCLAVVLATSLVLPACTGEDKEASAAKEACLEAVTAISGGLGVDAEESRYRLVRSLQVCDTAKLWTYYVHDWLTTGGGLYLHNFLDTIEAAIHEPPRPDLTDDQRARRWTGEALLGRICGLAPAVQKLRVCEDRMAVLTGDTAS